MNQTVNRFIHRHQLINTPATIVVGVSGGPDSMALLHFLWKQREYRELTVIVAHVDHRFRGEESYKDLVYVKEWCAARGIVCEATQIDVTAYKLEHKLSSQVAARECRYQFFDAVMKKHKANYLALAHHGDDQIETMLMRQVRGSLGLGLAGMPVKRPFSTGEIIRPFLGISKEMIEQYCNEEGILPRRDESNEKDDYVRNRLRHHVLPILKKENPNVHLRFQQQSELLRDDQLYLEQLASHELQSVLTKQTENECIVSVNRFNRMPIPLQRRMIQLILNYLYGQVPPSLSIIHIEGFISLLSDTYPSGQLDFPLGLKVIKSYNQCSLSFKKGGQTTDTPYYYPIHIPGIVTFKKGKIISEVLDHCPEHIDGNNMLICDLKHVTFPLVIRTRKTGDKISPIGMKGSKKIKDLFIDKKVSQDKRRYWPIVVDGTGSIIWVPGLKRSSLAMVSEQTTQYLVLTYQTCKE